MVYDINLLYHNNKYNFLYYFCNLIWQWRSQNPKIAMLYLYCQTIEKSKDYNKPAFLWFIDLTKAFNRVRTNDTVHMLFREDIPIDTIQTTKDIYHSIKIQDRVLKLNRKFNRWYTHWWWNQTKRFTKPVGLQYYEGSNNTKGWQWVSPRRHRNENSLLRRRRRDDCSNYCRFAYITP